jgi:hypothetical protein
MLYRADQSKELTTSNNSASSAGETRNVYLPHIDNLSMLGRRQFTRFSAASHSRRLIGQIIQWFPAIVSSR